MSLFKNEKLPLGATSLELVDRIYLEQVLEDEGATSLIPVLSSYATGKILEERGHYKDAEKLYMAALKRHPHNPWIKNAIKHISCVMN